MQIRFPSLLIYKGNNLLRIHNVTLWLFCKRIIVFTPSKFQYGDDVQKCQWHYIKWASCRQQWHPGHWHLWPCQGRTLYQGTIGSWASRFFYSFPNYCFLLKQLIFNKILLIIIMGFLCLRHSHLPYFNIQAVSIMYTFSLLKLWNFPL